MSDQAGSCCRGDSQPPEKEEPEVASCCGGGAKTEEPPVPKLASFSDYRPLIVLISITMLGSAAKQAHYGTGWSTMNWMADFMGFFLVVFAMFKLFDLSGFADGFQKYDLLAMQCRPYALAYPILELLLGLGYLARWQPVVVLSATVILLSFGALGVLGALIKGLDLNCACMGTALNVPLTTVALTEDLGMAGMALAMLLIGA